jgi:hypothetical protein
MRTNRIIHTKTATRSRYVDSVHPRQCPISATRNDHDDYVSRYFHTVEGECTICPIKNAHKMSLAVSRCRMTGRHPFQWNINGTYRSPIYGGIDTSSAQLLPSNFVVFRTFHSFQILTTTCLDRRFLRPIDVARFSCDVNT